MLIYIFKIYIYLYIYCCLFTFSESQIFFYQWPRGLCTSEHVGFEALAPVFPVAASLLSIICKRSDIRVEGACCHCVNRCLYRVLHFLWMYWLTSVKSHIHEKKRAWPICTECNCSDVNMYQYIKSYFLHAFCTPRHNQRQLKNIRISLESFFFF